jgi:hypothetical protein
MLEFRLDCNERARPESSNETIAAAMPFSHKGHGIIEWHWTHRGKEARLLDFGYKFVADSNDRLLTKRCAAR